MKVGITGHQEIGSPSDIAWVYEQLKEQVIRLNPSLGITSLAKGSDQLFATVLRELGKKFIVLVPCLNYMDSFTDSSALGAYQQLLEVADSVEVLPFKEPSEAAFLEAGKRIADDAAFMIAVWDGLPAKGLGGTADVVRYALSSGKPVVQLNPRTHTRHGLLDEKSS